jgi:hypothetical protein
VSTRTQGDHGGGGLSVSTLLIAAAASAAAAVVTSYLWPAGSVIAAAMTPVLVTIVKEMLERPTHRISRAVSTRGTSATEAIPEAAGPAPPAERGRERPVSDRPVVADRRRTETARPSAGSRLDNGRGGGRPEGVNVYGRPPRRRRRLHLGVAIVTGLLAFAIAGVVLTVPEVLFGKSVGSGDRETTFFGGKSKSSSKDSDEGQTQEEETTAPETTPQDQTAPQEDPSATTPEDQQTTPQETAPEEPPAQTPTPEAQPEGGAPAPAPQQPTP